MKRLMLTISLISAVLVMVVPAGMAMTVQVGYPTYPYGQYQTGIGGEFTLNPDATLSWILSNYSTDTKNVGVFGTFQTFCVEGSETIYPYPTIYTAVLSNNAIYGGNPPNGDPLSLGAAWLYYNFATGGNFGGYATYNYGAAGRSTTAGQLQNAIWWLEGEESITYDASNPFMLAVVTKFLTESGAKADNNGTYGVMLLNLWDIGHVGQSGYQHQDQLVLVPEPFTLLGLGICLVGVAGIRRKFKKFEV